MRLAMSPEAFMRRAAILPAALAVVVLGFLAPADVTAQEPRDAALDPADAAAAVATAMDRMRSEEPVSRDARLLQAVVEALPSVLDREVGQLLVDPRWGAEDARSGEAVLLSEDGELRISHGEAIEEGTLEELSSRTTFSLCEGGTDFTCVRGAEAAHLVFWKPTVSEGHTSVQAFVAFRPDAGAESVPEDRAYFRVVEFELEVNDARVRVVGHEPVARGHGIVPGG